MQDIAAACCADALIAGWISRYGVPAQLTSDRGTQFTSAIWNALCQQLGIQHQPTTAFHPQANGMVERCHRRLKNALRARLAGPGLASTPPLGPDGAESRPHRGHRSLRRRGRLWRTAGAAGANPRHGRAAAGRFHRQTATIRAAAAFAPPLLRADGRQAAGGAPLSSIRVRPEGRHGPPLSPLYSGPYKVLASGPKVFRLQVGEREETVSIDRLKPHRGAAPVQPAQPPARGRPRAG
jgi:hypothetical protein